MVQIVSSEISVNELIILKKYQSEIVFFFFPLGLASPIIKSVIFFVFEPVLKKGKKKDCCVDKKDN